MLTLLIGLFQGRFDWEWTYFALQHHSLFRHVILDVPVSNALGLYIHSYLNDSIDKWLISILDKYPFFLLSGLALGLSLLWSISMVISRLVAIA